MLGELAADRLRHDNDDDNDNYPEYWTRKVVEPCSGTWNFFDGLNVNFVRDGVSLNLDLYTLDCISKEFVPYLGIGFLNKDSVAWTVCEKVVTDVGTIETEGVEIDGVNFGLCSDGLDRDGLGNGTTRDQETEADGEIRRVCSCR